MFSLQRKPRRFALASAIVAVTMLAGACGSGSNNGGGSGEVSLVRVAQQDVSSYSRNFNPFSPNSLYMTKVAIYEPLIIVNTVASETVPWLAESWEFNSDSTALTFKLRDGVQWSDGESLSSQDVVTTFNLNREVMGESYNEFVESVEARDDLTVEFTFNRPYAPGIYEIGSMLIIPDHIWKDVEDPGTWTNEDPVGTGPFTNISNFQTQSYDLLKNENYWQEGKPKVDGVRMLGFSGNDALNLAAINGDVDWGVGFMQNIEDVYVSRDPENRQAWSPTVGSMIHFGLNTQVEPFDDVVVRKAISKAIDRDQVVQIGMMGYTHPADCTGLSDAYEAWKSAAVVDACDWTDLDVDGANKMLDDAGYAKGSDGIRVSPSGKKLSFDISVGAPSTDWVSVSQVISTNLKEIGIDANVRTGDWPQINEMLQQGNWESAILWSDLGATPYQYYRGQMSTRTVVPVGETTFVNFHRFGTEAADTLLDEFAATPDEAGQREIMNQLQALFAEDAPILPLFPGPAWGASNSTYFVGWPTADDPYTSLELGQPTAAIVLTTIEPRS